MSDNTILIICGPTATGKTSLGLKLAKEFNGEIVSADSRQVYRYMSVVTGKDLSSDAKYLRPRRTSLGLESSGVKYKMADLGMVSSWREAGFYKIKGVRIWGYDLVRPDEEFSVKLWRDFARRVIEDIWGRGKLPIVVGGTGLYLRVLTEPLGGVEVPRNLKLREVLKDKGAEELFKMLAKLDSERAGRMNESDRANPRRLVRAIEIARFRIRNYESRITKGNRERKVVSEKQGSASVAALSHPEFSSGSSEILKPSQWRARQVQNDGGNWGEDSDVKWIGLRCGSLKELYGRIDERVEERLADSRIVDELDYLIKKDYLRYAPSRTIGYKQLIAFMGGEMSFEEMAEKWKFAEHGYARRQMTWLRNQCPKVEWFEVGKKSCIKKVEEKVGKWLRMGGGQH